VSLSGVQPSQLQVLLHYSGTDLSVAQLQDLVQNLWVHHVQDDASLAQAQQLFPSNSGGISVVVQPSQVALNSSDDSP
jgi:hypothetical protein